MRYAIFTDIHANLEALEAVLAKIDEIAQEKPIEQIWFLGDLVGYGPNPNECITLLRERTDVIIAGNHDWAAVGKIDLEDFSAAARISAEWTAEQLTEEHSTFLANLPERLDIDECTLVHGSPYGPLWEYLTSEVLAERSFQFFTSRFCFVGHTHVPVIFQQADSIANAPTLPLTDLTKNGLSHYGEHSSEEQDEGEAELALMQSSLFTSSPAAHAESAYADPETGLPASEEDANTVIEAHQKDTERVQVGELTYSATTGEVVIAGVFSEEDAAHTDEEGASVDEGYAREDESSDVVDDGGSRDTVEEQVTVDDEEMSDEAVDEGQHPSMEEHASFAAVEVFEIEDSEESAEVEVVKDSEEGVEVGETDEATPEEIILSAEDRLNSEIEELLTLLGLSESMIQVTNEMLLPPEGPWLAPEGYRAIVNPGGVGQPRDGDPRAAFMIFDTEGLFEFYRVPYAFDVTQEKIVKAGLPQYLAIRLGVGR
jgi:diadenosine tetraphosphatase ApaH/serine/threonine PP2A family protein phosphatase